jgi:hypothetical protein
MGSNIISNTKPLINAKPIPLLLVGLSGRKLLKSTVEISRFGTNYRRI